MSEQESTMKAEIGRSDEFGGHHALGALIGESPRIRALRNQIGRLLQPDRALPRMPPILILGETGTGKGLLARAIHAAGTRASGPFVAINCAAIPESLLEGELFGFERGAFTDARYGKAGLFQAAHRGMLFLDEIGALPAGLQAKLLTALEERMVRRLGSLRSEAVDLWVVAATSEHLPVAVREGRFREDLYHRLAAITLTLPPLRERGPDVLCLAEHFLAESCREYARPPRQLTADARGALLAYRWPGNVRELANTMARAVLLTDEPLIGADALEFAFDGPDGDRAPERQDAPPTFRDRVDDFERSQLLAALVTTAWNTSRAARTLGIARNTLRYRIAKYGLRRPDPVIALAPIAAASRPPAPASERRVAPLRLAVSEPL
jgi:transcriptional regulator with PAS, ATPase and Fis domain